jgi:hypothetical protein
MRSARKAHVLEKLAKLRVIGDVSPENVAALEQLQSKPKKKKTYPISRFMTSPLASGSVAAVGGGVVGLLGAKRRIQAAARMGYPMPRSAKATLLLGTLLGVGAGAGIDSGMSFLRNKVRARALKGKANLNDKGWSSREEKQIIKSLQKK